MIINLYKYNGEKNRLNKTTMLSDTISLQGSARESINKMNVSVLIETNSPLNNYNYAYISEFGRYYFIDEMTIERNNIVRISLTNDVLMSHLASIGNVKGIVSRNETIYNSRLIDDKLRFLGYKEINTIRFPKSIRNSDCYILAVNGG